jgi:hypothetical protein
MPSEAGPVDLLEATTQWRRLAVLFVALWSIGFALSATREAARGPGAGDAAMIFECSTTPLLLGIIVGTAITAARLARALGLPDPWRWGAGAWVPCANPIVFLALTVTIVRAYSERNLGARMLLASRAEIEASLATSTRSPRT